MKPKLKAPGIKRLKLLYVGPLSNFAFKPNLRRYSEAFGSERATASTTLRPSSRGYGHTLVNFSAQLERFVWDRGCAGGYVARVKGLFGCVGCFLVPDTAQVELRSGRV